MTQTPAPGPFTGRGVRVALIDSGINAEHSHVESVAGGIGFSLADDGTVQESQDYTDQLGHGTALAGILRAKAPQVSLYAVKIFADRLGGPFVVLEAGLRWAIEQRMKIINLSLGTNKPEHQEQLAALVDQACAEGLLLVASSPPGRTDMVPAALPRVIGVAGDDQCGWEAYRYMPNDPIPFRAHPQPRPLPGLPQERNFRGHSFASAHVSALLALQAQQRPRLTAGEAKAFLMTYPD
jgi:subtilisin family serine protease